MSSARERSERRIRRAALTCFAESGRAASIRQIARAAGVSVGLVQNHFPTKAALETAVQEDLVALASDAFSGFPGEATGGDVFEEAGRRIAALQEREPDALRYLVRALLGGDPAAVEVFRALGETAETQLEGLAAHGLVRDDVDPPTVALQVIVLLLGTVAFEPAIRECLPLAARGASYLEDWHQAASSLFKRGIAATPPERSPPAV